MCIVSLLVFSFQARARSIPPKYCFFDEYYDAEQHEQDREHHDTRENAESDDYLHRL